MIARGNALDGVDTEARVRALDLREKGETIRLSVYVLDVVTSASAEAPEKRDCSSNQ